MVLYVRVGSHFSRSGTRPISGTSCHGSLRYVWSNLWKGLKLNLRGPRFSRFGPILTCRRPQEMDIALSATTYLYNNKSEVTWPVTGSWLKLIHAQNIRMSGFHSSNNLKLCEMHTSSSLCQSFRPLIRFSLKFLLGICHTICLNIFYFAHITASWYVFRWDQIVTYTTTTTWI